MTDPTGSKNTRPTDAKSERTEGEKFLDGNFDEDDADERGWIVYRDQPDDKGVRMEHRVPVKHWPLYERIHNL